MVKRTAKKKTTRRTRTHRKNISLLVGGESRCIFVPLRDGLGNQLFIYAAALVLKNKLKIPLCLLPAVSSTHTKRNYRKVLFSESTAVENSDPAIKNRMSKSPTVPETINGHHGKWVNTPIVANVSKNVILHSTYFQNYTEIQSVIPELRERIIGTLEKEFPDLKRTIDSATSGFMHVRRGDYDKVWSRSIGKNYYQNGLNEMSKVAALKTVYVFSNDLEWCKAQGFTIGGKALEFKDEPDELKALYLMSLCKCAALISASTFSLWAAIFGAATSPTPLIIYPKQWFLAGNSSTLELPKESEGWKVMATE
jgi:hypothetical protein